MAITGLTIEEQPATDELVHITMTADYARAWVAMLNMNRVRNSRGNRLTFALRYVHVTDQWVMETTEHED